MPDWVTLAVHEYTKRLKDTTSLSIIEIPLLKRGKSSDLARILDKEMATMSMNIPNGAHLIALEVGGESFTSEQLAKKIAQLQQVTSHLCFLIGGPEGLAPALITQCQERWSLSKLTLPHTLVRVTLLEALYRAWSILQNHPYHK